MKNENEDLKNQKQFIEFFRSAKRVRNLFFFSFFATILVTGLVTAAVFKFLGFMGADASKANNYAVFFGLVPFIFGIVVTLYYKSKTHHLACPRCGSIYSWFPYSFKCTKCGLSPWKLKK